MEISLSESAVQPYFDSLSSGKIEGIVAAIPENERPLHGLAGWLDWRFRGAITRALKQGSVLGKPGECAYLPVREGAATYHLILVGAGPAAAPGQRRKLPAESSRALNKNLASLKLKCVGLSRSDLGLGSANAAPHDLDGASVWIGE